MFRYKVSSAAVGEAERSGCFFVKNPCLITKIRLTLDEESYRIKLDLYGVYKGIASRGSFAVSLILRKRQDRHGYRILLNIREDMNG